MQLACIIYVGMGKLESAVIGGRFAEDDVLGSYLVVLDDVLGAAEPYQICHAVAIGEMRHEHLVTLAYIDFLVAQDLSLKLYEGHI